MRSVIPDHCPHSSPILVIPPAPSPFFYGRDEYVSSLIQLIKFGRERENGSRLIIHGTGGVGKTSVATALYHHPDIKALFSEHIYFSSCEAANSESLLLRVIASSFNLEQAKDVLGSVLLFIREAGHPIFLILDNFETCWSSDRRYEVHAVLKHLVALANLTLLLTMRGKDHPEIRWERVPELGVLTLTDAQKLFANIAGLDLPLDPLLDELLQDLDCLPLAVTLLAQLARHGESIETLRRRWTVERTTLLSNGNEDRHYSLDASIKISLSSSTMKNDQHALRLLQVLSYLPDGVPSGSLEKLGLFSLKEVYQASFTLRAVSLAYQDGTGALKSLSPIRHYISYHNPLGDDDLKNVQQYYLGLAKIAKHV
jgi:hypothetical protein